MRPRRQFLFNPTVREAKIVTLINAKLNLPSNKFLCDLTAGKIELNINVSQSWPLGVSEKWIILSFEKQRR